MSERDVEAQKIVSRFTKWAFAGGLIPVPFVDMAAVTAANVRMLALLAKQYDIPFKKDAAKSIVSSLVSGIVPHQLALGTMGVAAPLMKSVPVVGQVVSIATMPVFSSAITWAVGRVFLQHFASGGTFLDLDPEKVREHFEDEFEKAKASGAGAGAGGGKSGKAAAAP